MPTLPPGVLPRPACRVCGPNSAEPVPVLDLGTLDLVCFPKTPTGLPHPPVPVVVQRCAVCTLVQLRYTCPSDWLYAEYWYRSGTSEVMVAELRDIVEQARARVSGVTDRSLVVDIGANDGTLLKAWADTAKGLKQQPYRLAFEPATNLHQSLVGYAEQVFQTTFPHPDRAFAEAFADKVQVLTSIAMVYDLDQPHAFVAEVARVLAPDGLWIAQFQDLLTVLQTAAVDYFCHEHLECYSLYSFMQLVAAHGLHVVDVEHRPINGGSLRVYVQRRGTTAIAPEALHRIHAQVAVEAAAGIGPVLHEGKALKPWVEFAGRVREMIGQVRGVVDQAVDRDDTVDLYGASTKGTILLQLCGLNSHSIRQAWERSSQKVGRFVAGTGVRIVNEARGREDPPALLLVPIWQFREAVIRREVEYLARGGAMLFPLPAPAEVYKLGLGTGEGVGA